MGKAVCQANLTAVSEAPDPPCKTTAAATPDNWSVKVSPAVSGAITVAS